MENARSGVRRRGLVASGSVAVLVLTAAAALAAPPAYQTGLPPSLVIETKTVAGGAIDQTWLRDQARLLGALAEHKQPDSVQVPWWRRVMSGSGAKVKRLPLDQLATNAEQLRGQLIEVTGLWLASKSASGELRTADTTCLVELAEGARPEGFADDKVVGMPVAVEGTVEVRGNQPLIRATRVSPGAALAALRQARVLELLGDNQTAIEAYTKAEPRLRQVDISLAAFARVSAGRIAFDQMRDTGAARKHWNMAWTQYVTNILPGMVTPRVWMPKAETSTWTSSSVRDAIGDTLDHINGESFWYRFVAFFVALCGGSPALGVLLIALVVRVVIWPLTKKQLQSAEAMKKLQPQIKELQARHADDKQRFQQEFWRMCQANGVNPLGGCLPLIIQMPVLIMVYQGIRLYIVEFDRASFLWVKSLGGPDTVLLVAYTLSMILFQKMTQRTNPQAVMDPQQEQQQKMMMYMMPLMFFFMFKTFPAAFILYWLGTNIIYFLQQWNYTRRLELADSTPSAAGPRGGLLGSIRHLLSGDPKPASSAGPETNRPAKPAADTRRRKGDRGAKRK